MIDTTGADAEHSTPDILAMMAMGETDIPLTEERHIAGCPECLAELNSLRRVTSLARSGSPLENQLDAPGPAVWGSISSTLGLAADVIPGPFGLGTSVETPSARGHRGHRIHRGRRRLVVPLIAGALVVVAATGAILVASNAPVPKTVATQPTILAEARLKALPDWTGSSGDALIEKLGSQRQVVVTVSESRTAPGYREVWLISRDLTKLISVGVLVGTQGRFTIPSDVNLADYPIVDVSSEMPDGNPAHSGDSIVRGTL